MTQTSHRAAIFDRSSLHFFSPLLQRLFSSMTTSPGFDFEATIDPVLDQANFLAEEFGHALGDWGQRIFVLELTFGRTTEVRGDHHGGAFGQCVLDARQRARTRVSSVMARLSSLRDVEVGADEDTLGGHIQIGEAFESHGSTRFEAGS